MASSPDLPDSADQPTTRWSSLAELGGTQAELAWRAFLERYRPFVHAIIKRKIARPDLLQAAEEEFWGYLFLSGAVPRADRARRFRPFLAGIVHNFVQAWMRKHADRLHESVSLLPAPEHPAGDVELPAWAANVLTIALDKLGAESTVTAAALRGFYGIGAQGSGEPATPQSASQLATNLSCSLANAYQLLSRGRRRLRALVEAELLAGCGSRAELDEEWQLLIRGIGSQHPGLFLPD